MCACVLVSVVPQYNQHFRCADEDAIYAYFDSCDSSAATPPAGSLTFSQRFSDVDHHGMDYERAVRVPAGMYYFVIDNTPSAVQVAATAPPIRGIGDAGAVAGYAVLAGDGP